MERNRRARYPGRCFAATGDFESAVKWQTKSNALARSAVEQKEGEARLKRYREKRPILSSLGASLRSLSSRASR